MKHRRLLSEPKENYRDRSSRCNIWELPTKEHKFCDTVTSSGRPFKSDLDLALFTSFHLKTDV